jgi:16S rRNA U516 pseudouridylate synthase RsuA-like enzyme
LGLDVNRLIRVRQGPIQLGKLKPGEYRSLSKKEVGLLAALAFQTVKKRSKRSKQSAAEKRA